MSTINCPACNDKVSTAASMCPHCGHPISVGRTGFEGLKNLIGCAAQIAVVGFVIILIVSLFTSCSNEDSHDRDRDGNRTTLSYSEEEWDTNLDLAGKNCTQSDPEVRKQCLISYLGCSAITGDVTCDD